MSLTSLARDTDILYQIDTNASYFKGNLILTCLSVFGINALCSLNIFGIFFIHIALQVIYREKR